MNWERLKTDILILGSGGAGLFAALHAHKADPDLSITVAVKGLLGKCGCTRMVQGGYNVALDPKDSIERHFMDTIRGGSCRITSYNVCYTKLLRTVSSTRTVWPVEAAAGAESIVTARSTGG